MMEAVLGLYLTYRLVGVLELSMDVKIFNSRRNGVLWWIREHVRNFLAFVANRIWEIQLSTKPVEWQHVPADGNPADLYTRGANPQELSESSFSWNRPEWLLKDRSTWLKMRMKNRPSNSSEDRPNKKSSNEDGVVILNTCYCQHPALRQKESNERKVVKGRLDLELMHSRDSQIAVKFKGDE